MSKVEHIIHFHDLSVMRVRVTIRFSWRFWLRFYTARVLLWLLVALTGADVTINDEEPSED